MKTTFSIILGTLILSTLSAASSWDKSDPEGGYLFAHMTYEDYGSLYYSYSEDGLSWKELNKGEKVHPNYRGHPDICKGRDGVYYQLGVEDKSHEVILWQSNNLLDWKEENRLPKSIFANTPGHKGNPSWWGAPKTFYDINTDRYIITWHVPTKGTTKDDPAEYWGSMRTFYVLTKDFESFTEPKKLLQYDMATIDVIIRKEGDLYYAIIKDEREATVDWPTGKSVRIAVSRNLTGPYSYPGPKTTPSYREAPTVISKKDGSGWYMYTEQYPGVNYHVSEAPALAGPWFDVYTMRYELPKGVRHGCMISISKDEKEAILKKYEKPIKNL